MVTDRDYWECVTRLGRLEPSDAELTHGIRLAGGLDPQRLYAAILASRVYTLATVHLDAPEALTPHTRPVLAKLRALADSETQRRHRAAPETLAVLQYAASGTARVIKGLPLRELYVRPELRHEGDIDLQTPDWPAAIRFARWLRERGWQWDTAEFPWLKWTDGGHLYGQLSLVYADTTDPFARVDLHIGPYSVGYAGMLPLVGWRATTVLGLTVDAPDQETTVALIAAHAMNDGTLSMKDVNDLWTLLARTPSIDWGSIEELCRQAGSLPALRQLLSVTNEVYARGDGSTPEVLCYRLSRQARGRRVARLTYADERSRGIRPWRAVRTAMSARRYYTTDLDPQLVRTRVDPPPSRGVRRRDVCWRLLPRETWSRFEDSGLPRANPTTEELAADLTVIRSAGGCVIQTIGEVFVPTVWGRVNPDSVALARRVAN